MNGRKDKNDQKKTRSGSWRDAKSRDITESESEHQTTRNTTENNQTEDATIQDETEDENELIEQSTMR